MWSTTVTAGDDGTRPIWEPPDNEIPVGVPGVVVLARTDDVAVAWTGAAVHSTGVLFDLVITARTTVEDLSEQVFGGRRSRGLLLGVEFADGRRTTLHGDDPSGLLLTSRGGGGGGRSVRQGCWLHPVPPAGPLAVVLLAPGLGIAETRVELDAGPFAAAVAGVQELWPWTPDDAELGLAEPDLDLPEGSWFRTG